MNIGPVTTVTAVYTIVTANSVILANPAGGSFTVTLPTAVGVQGQQFIVRNIATGGNSVTLAASGSQKIDGKSSVVLAPEMPYLGVSVVSDGANWWLV